MTEDKKKFIMLIYGTGEGMSEMPEEDRDAHMQEWNEWFEKLGKDEVLIAGDPLGTDAKTIRGNDREVSDGYFVPDKDHALGGYVIVYADSMDKAVEIFKECPTLDLDGAVEVREIVPM